MIERDTLPLRLEAALRTDIVSGVLEPGQRLRGTELSKQYQVSPTPLREALQRLALQGLVELDPQQGARVAPISLDDVHDVYRLRITLETVALRDAIERGDEAWRQQVAATMRDLREREMGFRRDPPAGGHRGPDWTKSHAAFHLTLYSATDSPWLMRFLSILSDHSERYRMLSVEQPDTDRNVLLEHERVAAAVAARDADEASVALREHLETTVALLDDKFSGEANGLEISTTEGVAKPSA